MSSPIQNDETNTGMITSRTPGATVAVRMSRGGADADVMARELPPSAKYFRRQESFATRTRARGARMTPGSMLPRRSAATWKD